MLQTLPIPSPHAVRVGALALGLLTPLAAAGGEGATGDDDKSPVRAAVLDEFHPDKGDGAKPLYGGRAIIHIPSLPESTNYAVENSAYTRNFLYECHEMLLLQDWWSTEYVPSTARKFVVEDLVILAADAPKVTGEIEATVVRRDGGDGPRVVRALYGNASVGESGVTVAPRSRKSALEIPVTIPESSVERVERGSVFTFELRDDVVWHTSRIHDPKAHPKVAGQTLDARDVHFSWSIYQNAGVDCDEKRFQFVKFPTCEIVDDLTVRFFSDKQDAFALGGLGTSLTLLPSHIYDLSDPDNPDHDENASAAKQAEHINDNPHNKLWVGLGPYQIVDWNQQWVDAKRFVDEKGQPAYFDLSNAGYFDGIRWRYIQDDQGSMNALLNGELDYFGRVKSEDYFEGQTLTETFTDTFFKGHFYTGFYGYTGWNLYDPALKDIAVRKAICHAFDFDSYLTNQYNGLAYRVTGPVPYISPAYNHDVEPLEYDPDLALEILEDAGWYDRDDDGIADKDGVKLEIEFLYPGGNDASKIFGRALQEAVADLGIKINLETMEWATFLERIKTREFQGCNLAWIPELESDPEQLWGSKWGEYERKSSNNSGLQDAEVDELIARIQTEVDRDKRFAIWKDFHAKIYALQPYLFMYNVPRKYAANLKIRGIKHTPIDPGYVLRDWYYVDPSVPGTRPALKK